MDLKIVFGNEAFSALCSGAWAQENLDGISYAIDQSVRQRENLFGLRSPFRGVSLCDEGEYRKALVLQVSDVAINCMRKTIVSLPSRIEIILQDELYEIDEINDICGGNLAGYARVVKVSPASDEDLQKKIKGITLG